MPTVANRHRFLPVAGWGPAARPLTGRERRPPMPADAIYAGRGSPLGNPYRREQYGDEALTLYRRWLATKIRRLDPSVMRALASIGDDTLVVCSCAPKPCQAANADVFHRVGAMMITLERHDPQGLRCDIAGVRHYVGGPIGSHPLVSVTAVLAATSEIESSWGYRVWRDRHESIECGLAAAARDVAAARGTKLDREVRDALVGGTEPTEPDSWFASVRATVRQLRSVARLVLADAVVWSLGDGVAGTIDLLLEIAGGLWLFDVKTSAKPWSDERIALAMAQLGGYARCIDWTYGRTLAGCGFLVALPDAPAQVRTSGHRSFTVGDTLRAWDDRLARFHR